MAWLVFWRTPKDLKLDGYKKSDELLAMGRDMLETEKTASDYVQLVLMRSLSDVIPFSRDNDILNIIQLRWCNYIVKTPNSDT